MTMLVEISTWLRPVMTVVLLGLLLSAVVVLIWALAISAPKVGGDDDPVIDYRRLD